MKGAALPLSAVSFHVVALAFFGGNAAWLVHESRLLGGRRGMLDLGVAVASAGIVLLSLVALRSLLRARALVTLRSRAEMGTYVQVLAALAILGVVGVHLLTSDARPALAAFCLGLAGWLCGIGLHLVPALFLTSDGFVDHLGKRTRFTDLEWFTLKKTGDAELPRVLLQAGQGTRLRLDVRLVDTSGEHVRKTLVEAGLASRSPGR